MSEGKGNESVANIGNPEKKKFFTTPVAKLSRNIVRGGGNRRNATANKLLAASGANANSSIMYKQSLKANNKNLAKALDLSKQDTAALARKVLELEQEKQEQTAKISVLRRLTDDSSEAVEMEIGRRMKLRMDRFKMKLQSAANMLHMAGDELHDVIVMCDHQHIKDIDEIVKDTLEFTQMCTPDQFSRLANSGKKRCVYPSSNLPEQQTATSAATDDLSMGTDIEGFSQLPSLEDDHESRLSIVSEAAESKRKSSLRRESLGLKEVSRLSKDESPPATLTRSKRRTMRESNRLSTKANSDNCGEDADEKSSEQEVASESPEESKPITRKSYTVSRSKRRKADRAENSVKLLEPLISAAAAPTCQSPGENDIPPERVSHGPVVHSPVISRTPVTDVTASNTDDVGETTTEQAAESIVPYDEIPVGSKYALEEARKLAAAENCTVLSRSRSRRQTRFIKAGNSEDLHTQAVLDGAAEKFFIQLSPPKIFSEARASPSEDGEPNTCSRARRASRRGTYCIKDHTTDMVNHEDDSLLVANSSVSDIEDGLTDIEMAANNGGETETVAESEGSLNETKEDRDDVPDPDDDTDPDYAPERSPAKKSSSQTKAQSDVEDPPVRQMEIQWKAGQVKVNVAGRDGGPVRTKGRKKKAKPKPQEVAVKTSEFDFECTPPPPKSKDPFDLSMSSTVDFTQALHSLREKQEANKRDKLLKAEQKSKGRKTHTLGNRTESSSAAEFSEDEVKDPPTTMRGRKTITITKYEETQPSENKIGVETKPHKGKKGRKDQVPKKEIISNDATTSSAHELTDGEETNAETKPQNSKKDRKDKVSKKKITSNDAIASSSHELTDNEEAVHSEPMDKNSLSETDSIVSQDGKHKKRKIKLTSKSSRKPVVDHPTETESDRESVASETSEPDNKKLKKSKPKRTQKKKGGKKSRAQSEQLDNDAENTPTNMCPRLQQVTETKSKSTTSHKYSLQLEEATPIQINKRRGRTNLGVSPAASATASLSLTDVDLNAVSDDDTLTKDISAISQHCDDVDLKVQQSEEDEHMSQEEPQTDESSPPRRARRAAANICFKEPSLGGKLRRGDPGTSTLYGNVDIYANPKDKKHYKKKS